MEPGVSKAAPLVSILLASHRLNRKDGLHLQTFLACFVCAELYVSLAPDRPANRGGAAPPDDV